MLIRQFPSPQILSLVCMIHADYYVLAVGGTFDDHYLSNIITYRARAAAQQKYENLFIRIYDLPATFSKQYYILLGEVTIIVYNHRSYILLLWSISKKGKLMKHLQTRSCSSIETLSISATSNSFSSQSRSLFQVNYYFCIYNIIVIFVLQ